MVSGVSGYQTGNIDYTQWRTKSITDMSVPVHAQISQPIQQEGDNAQLSNTSSETCTDGKDDGKIGFFSAIGNAIKGIGKTIVNGVKGMFTGKDGKFSLGKTLLSLGTAALCIACPAVGVAACVVGGTMGAVQVGKGIYNAATAKTDAEAKEAWQNIGGGAFTVGMSVVGAKAGVKAIKNSAGNGSALQALENNGTKLSTKTLGQYGKALGKDVVSSTKNNFSKIKSNVGSTAEALKPTTDAIKHPIKNAKKVLDSDKATKALDVAKHPIKNAKKVLDSDKANKALDIAKHPIENAKKVVKSEKATKAFDSAKHPFETLKNIPSKLSEGAKSVIKALQNTDSSYAQLVKKYGYDNVAEALEYLGGFEIASQNI